MRRFNPFTLAGATQRIHSARHGASRIALCLSCLTAITLAPTLSAQTVFKKTGPDGTVEFSDTPAQNAKQIEIESPTAYDLRTTVPPSNPGSQQSTQPKAGSYSDVSIISPANDSTQRSNAGTLTVTGQVLPRLQRDHQLVLQSNGTTIAGPQRGASFTLQNLSRGTHALTLSVVDGSGKVLISSPTTTVHLLRAAVGGRAR